MTKPQRIAYFISEFPCVSHTFIRREINALRARGVNISTYSIRKTAPDIQNLEVTALFPTTPRHLFGICSSFCKNLLTQPLILCKVYRLAVSHRLPGLKRLLWAHFYFAEALLLSTWLQRDGVNRLHVHFANSGAHIGILVHTLTGIPWSMTLHGACDFEYPAGPLLPEKLRSADFVAFASYYGRAQAMRAVEPIHWDKFHIVRCGVDTEDVHKSGQLRRLKPIRNLYSIGRLSPEKGQIVVLKALGLISKDVPDLQLHLIGDGPSRGELEHMAQLLGLADKVIFHGAIAENEVWEHLKNADCLTLGSFMEGIPLALMEAMAVGVPVVAPRIAGIPELIVEGESGLLFQPADCEELAGKLHQLIHMSSEALALMVDRGKSRIYGEFTVNKSSEVLARLFEA